MTLLDDYNNKRTCLINNILSKQEKVLSDLLDEARMIYQITDEDRKLNHFWMKEYFGYTRDLVSRDELKHLVTAGNVVLENAVKNNTMTMTDTELKDVLIAEIMLRNTPVDETSGLMCIQQAGGTGIAIFDETCISEPDEDITMTRDELVSTLIYGYIARERVFKGDSSDQEFNSLIEETYALFRTANTVRTKNDTMSSVELKLIDDSKNEEEIVKSKVFHNDIRINTSKLRNRAEKQRRVMALEFLPYRSRPDNF
jgi:hypothetical protein